MIRRLTVMAICTTLFSCLESKSPIIEHTQNAVIENNIKTLNQSNMKDTNAIQTKNIKLQSIELEHTNPSLGSDEKIITITLENSIETSERITEFLDTSIINDAITIGEYIEAHINKDTVILSKVRPNFDSNNKLNQGESISNLTFYFKNNIPSLEISDVYRRYCLTNFYDDFTKYMVENGSRDETSNGLGVPQAINDSTPEFRAIPNYSEKNMIISFRQTPGGPGSTSFELKIFGNSNFTYLEKSTKITAQNNFSNRGEISEEKINLIFSEAERINYKELTADCYLKRLAYDGQEIIFELWGYRPNSSNDKCANADKINSFKNWVWDVLKEEIAIDE